MFLTTQTILPLDFYSCSLQLHNLWSDERNASRSLERFFWDVDHQFFKPRLKENRLTACKLLFRIDHMLDKHVKHVKDLIGVKRVVS
jgi:hypothetical protein